MLTLLPDHRRTQLPIEDQFFIRYFWKMRFPQSKIKFFSLWRMIRDGSLGIDEARWPEVAQTYADVNAMFGDVIKVTPTSKVVRVRSDDFSNSIAT